MPSAGFYPGGGGRLDAWIEPATPRPLVLDRPRPAVDGPRRGGGLPAHRGDRRADARPRRASGSGRCGIDRPRSTSSSGRPGGHGAAIALTADRRRDPPPRSSAWASAASPPRPSPTRPSTSCSPTSTPRRRRRPPLGRPAPPPPGPRRGPERLHRLRGDRAPPDQRRHPRRLPRPPDRHRRAPTTARPAGRRRLRWGRSDSRRPPRTATGDPLWGDSGGPIPRPTYRLSSMRDAIRVRRDRFEDHLRTDLDALERTPLMRPRRRIDFGSDRPWVISVGEGYPVAASEPGRLPPALHPSGRGHQGAGLGAVEGLDGRRPRRGPVVRPRPGLAARAVELVEILPDLVVLRRQPDRLLEIRADHPLRETQFRPRDCPPLVEPSLDVVAAGRSMARSHILQAFVESASASRS